MKKYQNHIRQILLLALSLVVAMTMGAGMFAMVSFAPHGGVCYVKPVLAEDGMETAHAFDSEASGSNAAPELSKMTLLGDARSHGLVLVALNVEHVLQDNRIHAAETSNATSVLDDGWPEVEGDANRDGLVDIVDMSDIIDWFGITADDAVWEELYTWFDFNDNEEINIYDIACVAQLIGNGVDQNDRAALEWLIARMQSLLKENYTADSWFALEEALKAAIEVSENTEVLDEELAEVVTAMREALRALERPSDMDMLKRLSVVAQTLQEESYTADSWFALEEALEAAIEVSENSEASNEEVTEAMESLQEAVGLLVWVARNLEQLQQVIDEYEGRLNESEYPAGLWAEFMDALEHGKNILASPDRVPPSNVNAAIEVIHQTYKALLEARMEDIHTEVLSIFINMAQTLLEDSEQYTQGGVEPLEQVLAKAMEELDSPNSQAEVDAQARGVWNAIEGLAEVGDIDISELLVASIRDYESESYTEESWNALLAAVEMAQEVIDGVEQPVDAVKEAMNALAEALLTLDRVDAGTETVECTEVLSIFINMAQTLLEDSEQYTQGGVEPLEQVLAKAMEELDSPHSQAEVDEQARGVWDAIEGLAEVGDIDISELLVASIRDYESESYTEESWNALLAAVEMAQEVIDGVEQPVDAVKEAMNALAEALLTLDRVDAGTETVECTEVLSIFINMAQTLLEDSEQYTQGGVEPLEQVLAKAMEELDSPNSQAEVDAQARGVWNAIEGLAEVGDTGILELLLVSIRDHESESYTEESWNALLAAVEMAQEVIDGEEQPVDTVKEAMNALAEALLTLDRVDAGIETVDREALEAVINYAEWIMENPELFIAESLKGLGETMGEAMTMYKDDSGSQAAVDAAAMMLITCSEKVCMKADLGELKMLLAKTKAICLNEYTATSANRIREAIAAAERLGENASQKEVEEASQELREATSALVARDSDGAIDGDQQV